MAVRVVVLALIMALASCGQAEGGLSDLEIGFDLDAALDHVRDCDALVDRLVNAAVSVAEKVDELAADREGPLADTEIADVVSRISVSGYFNLAEQIGCNSVELRVQAVDRLRDAAADSDVAESVLREVIDQINESAQ